MIRSTIAQCWQFSRSLTSLVVLYAAAQVLGLVIWHGGEIARHYSIRGTPFPVENGEPVYPEFWAVQRDTPLFQLPGGAVVHVTAEEAALLKQVAGQ